jgi:hypothetical protein
MSLKNTKNNNENKCIIDHANNLFYYENKKFHFRKIDEKIYLYANDVLKFLNNSPDNSNVGQSEILEKKENNEKKFYATDLTSNLSNKTSHILKEKIILDTYSITSFYDSQTIVKFENIGVVYIAVIGMYENYYLCKFGMSRNIYERDYKSHRNTYGQQFKMVFIAETDNNAVVEKEFKKMIKLKNINVKLNFKGKEKTELFLTTKDFSIQNAIDYMKQLVKNHPLESVKIRDDKIKDLESKVENDKYIVVAKEKTKQTELHLEKEKEKTKREEIVKEKLGIKLKLFEIKSNNKDKDNKDSIKINDIYLNFLNECTENSQKHIHFIDLYESFKLWFEQNNPNVKIPSNKEFYANIKKHKKQEIIKINNKSQAGIRNLKLKENLNK